MLCKATLRPLSARHMAIVWNVPGYIEWTCLTHCHVKTIPTTYHVFSPIKNKHGFDKQYGFVKYYEFDKQLLTRRVSIPKILYKYKRM